MSSSIIGYATIMDPKNAENIGLPGVPDPVWVGGHQRFFGFPDPSLDGKTLDDVFGEDGALLVPSIGATTVAQNITESFNAVIYRDVSDRALCALDAIEANSNLGRESLDPTFIRVFGKEYAWNPLGSPVFIYVASHELVRSDVIPHAGYLQRCRDAADAQGYAFRKVYEETTYLADKKTSLSQSGL
jgi:hypothetical protein